MIKKKALLCAVLVLALAVQAALAEGYRVEEKDGKYALGEEITYEITVTNDGNLTITNITVTDELTGDNWPVKSLAPGASATFEAKHTVTEEDAKAGTVLNVATATGKSPDPDEPEVPVEPGKVSDDVVPRYRLTVNYWIGTTRAADSFTNMYNSGDAYDVASPVLNGYTVDKARVTGTITKDTTLDVYYTVNTYYLTINYIFLNGATAAPTFSTRVDYGTDYRVESPAVNGYTPDEPVVEGRMPARDVTVTVIYTANPRPAAVVTPPLALGHVPYAILDDYDTALGIPNLSINAGEVYE